MNGFLRRSVLCLLLAAGLPAFAAPPSGVAAPGHIGGPWYVSPAGKDTNDCATVLSPCATIGAALARPEFLPGDTVLVQAGVYTGAGEQALLLDRTAVLSGGWNDSFTVQDEYSVLDGQAARRGLTAARGITATVARFRIQNGVTTKGLASGCDGGGVLNLGSLTLSDSIVAGNSTHPGCDGGGIHNAGTLRLVRSSVTNNSTGSGSGGGIRNAGTLVAVNSTISGNATMSGAGGGLSNAGAAGLYNVTLSDNSPGAGFAGGLWTAEEGELVMQNSIVAGNWGLLEPDCSGPVLSGGYNLIGDAEGCEITGGAGDLRNVPAGLFALLGEPGVHPLLPGSPARDAGDPAGCRSDKGALLTADQRGVARVGRCDIGAYEFDPARDPLKHRWLPVGGG